MEDFHNCDQEKFKMVGASLGLGPGLGTRKIAFQYWDSHPVQACTGSDQSWSSDSGGMGSEATTFNITTATQQSGIRVSKPREKSKRIDCCTHNLLS